MYALEQNAKLLEPDRDLKTYLDTLDLLDLLDADGVDAVLDGLTIVQRVNGTNRQEIVDALTGHGEAVTVGGHSLRKVAFGANYSTTGNYYEINHGTRIEHGSHVAGITAANRYVPTLDCWDPVTGKLKTDTPDYELPTVTVQKEEETRADTGEPGEEPEAEKKVTVQGQAPDAQLLVMQVFSSSPYGGGGNTSESDYLAAIQDALVLGADAVNLSLGSSAPGATFSMTMASQNTVNRLVNSGAVVTAAHGNSYYWT